MKKILLWLWLLTKRQLKSSFFLLLIIAIPVIAFSVSQTESFGEAATNKVALYRCDDDLVAKNTIEDLTGTISAYDFYICENEEDVYDAVLNGAAVCGYVFNENISELIKEEKYKDHITVVKNKGDMLANMVNEVVFAAYFKEFTKQVMNNYIMGNEKFEGVTQEAILQLDGAYATYVDGNGTFKVEFESLKVGGTFADTEEIKEKAMTFPLRGVMAVLIFMGGLLGAVKWLSDHEQGVFSTLGYSFVNMSRFFYVIIPAALLGVCTIISMIVSSNSTDAIRELAIMLMYIGLISIVGVFCTLVFSKSISLVSIMPLMLMGCILLCPVFIDLSTYIPVIKVIRYIFVPYYYMVFF